VSQAESVTRSAPRERSRVSRTTPITVNSDEDR
jgi:hypothetical protein